MPKAWGTATANAGGGGGSDPNVVKLGENTRIRLLDAEGPRKWRQHGVDGKVLHKLFPDVDESTFRSIVDPRGPDGTGSAPCPCCMKPSWLDDDGKVEQLFPISVRFAANVWDYESNSVKVLIAGKQVFAEFDAVASVGFDATANDFVIFKMGKGQQTSYKVVRGGDAPLPVVVTPEMLHDLDKYEMPSSADRIFEILAEIGVDYDAIPVPEFAIEDALQFQMPYTKHKGLTLEQLYATDPDFMKWLYGTKREQGQYGDAVFQAMHSVLLDAGDVMPLDDLPKAPPRATVKPPPAGPSIGAEAMSGDAVLLVAPGATEAQEFPRSAMAGLLAAGFTEPAPPVPEPSDGPVILVSPDGFEVDVFAMPNAAIAGMLKAGFTPKGVPADTDMVTVQIGTSQTQMPYGAAKTIIESGAATLVGGTNA